MNFFSWNIDSILSEKDAMSKAAKLAEKDEMVNNQDVFNNGEIVKEEELTAVMRDLCQSIFANLNALVTAIFSRC